MRTIFSFFLCVMLGLTTSFAVAPETVAQNNKLPFEAPKDVSKLPRAARIETSKGLFKIDFLRSVAPIHVRNFEYLARKGFYTNLTFHRYVPGFVVQGGDPAGTGEGGSGYLLPPEFSTRKHVRGTIGMARKPSEINPERLSNGSQFYIALTPARHLDGLYTTFAEVTDGMDTVDQLRPGDKILRIILEP